MLRLTDITVDYGGGATAVHALQGVDLSVERGEVVLVVGPSGAARPPRCW
ncbi:hypothetical protein BZL30_4229 [Mycobacterium kansasii]|uniref:Uncharacterized protein n=1 Tax=Mycobacterium kansasii TaxID=1768 RepID=A0A1V3XAZ0_MYCKA|nr:hypothetical protein BZL29_5739 [Mycobacterium kansasii]OOK76307.1 hypothetical protein BZL30_4229 [Mycobacterium kansasii]